MWIMVNFLRRQKIKLVFSYDYYIGISTSNAYQSFDIMKYKKIRDRLINDKQISRKHILAPEMVSYQDMALVHEETYLKNIQDPLKLANIYVLELLNRGTRISSNSFVLLQVGPF